MMLEIAVSMSDIGAITCSHGIGVAAAYALQLESTAQADTIEKRMSGVIKYLRSG